MREIRFRAWDEARHEMHTDFQFIRSGDAGNDWIVFTSDRHPLNSKPHPFDDPFFQQQFVIEQFTGLKDKNGKQIYEGDIVRRQAFEYPEQPGEKLIDDLVGVVIWSPYYAAFKFSLGDEEDQAEYRYLRLGNVRCEVLGNIHQNPELLNAPAQETNS